ncbi:MAG: N-glycosylase/DNA lyase [Patescibacteria group bacterium]
METGPRLAGTQNFVCLQAAFLSARAMRVRAWQEHKILCSCAPAGGGPPARQYIMQNLTNKIQELKKSPVKNQIDRRISEFKKAGRGSDDEVFKELCFCLLTANSTARQCLRVHSLVGDGFLNLPENKLQKVLKQCGARFHTKRAHYIALAQKHKNELKELMKKLNEFELRNWLVENIKGLGWKEASHFLRNIGYDDLAIIDFHIIDILEKEGLIERPKSLNKKNYLEIENILRQIGQKAGLNLAELDLYLWYLETNTVLK